MSSTEIIYLLIVVLFGSIVTTITGFGGGIVRVPCMLLLFPLRFVSPFENLLGLINNIILFKPLAKDINRKLLVYLLIGNFIGALIGGYLLKQYYNPNFVKFIGLVVFGWEIKSLWEIFINPNTSNIKTAPVINYQISSSVGFVSGVMSAVFSIGGPPLVIFLKNILPDKEIMRKTLISFFTINGFMQVFSLGINGLITWSILGYSLLAFPVLYLGTVIGKYIVNRIPQRTYQILVSLLLLFAGLTLMFK